MSVCDVEVVLNEGRRKKEEGRRKKEWRMEDEGWMEEGRRKFLDGDWDANSKRTT
jgi:hypothetical protein